MISRRVSQAVRVGSVVVGGDAPIVVQSMTKTFTADVRATVNQVHELQEIGCEIIRVAVPDAEAAACLGEIKKGIAIPLIGIFTSITGWPSRRWSPEWTACALTRATYATRST